MPNVFEPGSSKTATLKVKNNTNASVTFDFVLGLGLGLTPSVYEVSAQASATFAIDEIKDIPFELVIPMVQDIYNVFVDVSHEGAPVVGYIGTEPVTVYAVPAIQIIDITWT